MTTTTSAATNFFMKIPLFTVLLPQKVLQWHWRESILLGPVQERGEIFNERRPEVHQHDVPGLELDPLLELHPPVVDRGRPVDQRLEPTTGRRLTRRRVVVAERRPEQRRPLAVVGGQEIRVPADLVLLELQRLALQV